MTEERTWDFKSKQYKDKEDKIVPPFIGESIERSKRRKQKLEEIIILAKEVGWCSEGDISTVIEKLEKFSEEEL